MTPEDKKILGDLLDECLHSAEYAECPEDRDSYRQRAKALAQALSDSSEVKCKACHPELPLKLEFAKEDVPWSRKGYLGSLSTDLPKWGKEYANVSVCRDRLLTDAQMREFPTRGVEERAFAAAWDFECNCRSSGGILSLLMSEEPIVSLLRDQRDVWLVQLVAQAIIQWLGTNCGHCFVEEARKLAETDSKRLEDEHRFLQKLTNCPAGKNRD